MHSRMALVVRLTILIGTVFGLSAGSSMAAVPQLLNFQGILLDPDGGTVDDSTYQLVFSIYDDSTGGAPLWTEIQVVTTENGLFTTFLGQVVPVPDAVFDGPDRWLEIELVGIGPYFPRTRLGSVAYAYKVQSINGAAGGNILGDIVASGLIRSGESIIIDGPSRTISTESASLSITTTETIITDKVSIGPGHINTGAFAFVVGDDHEATGYGSAVLGGSTCAALEDYAMAAGASDTAFGAYSIAVGGVANKAIGLCSTVPGGELNEATGWYTFAAGRRAKAEDDGCFAWADANDVDFPSADDSLFVPTANMFMVRSTGGTVFITAVDGAGNSLSGVQLDEGAGSWSSLSDRNLKENVEPIDGADVLAKIASLPISTWNYQAQDDAVRHIGPMAQDFYAAFGVGEDNRHITTIDADGVALAAIQEMYRQARESDARKSREIAELRSQIAALKELIDRQLTATQQAGE